jgi:single-strand DNA-binding protein
MTEQITVVGTIVNDPERRRTGAGHTVVGFRLASNARRRDEATGAWTDGHTNWYAVSAYRGLAEHALESLRKGHRVIVTGAFRLREWEANGRQGVSAEIDATSLGQDLLWGTTVYRRDDRGAAQEEPAGAEPAWSAPLQHGRAAQTADEASRARDDGSRPAVAATGWSPITPEDAVPF